MTPQSAFMLVAKVTPGREAELRTLLRSMNREPGRADPHNALLPFGKFERLHFARWIVLDDATVVDHATLGLAMPQFPLQVVFMGDCDGDAHEMLAELARTAEPGLRQLFAQCEGFDDNADLLAWMLAHNIRVDANYVNWRGRTTRQIKEESALQRLLTRIVPREVLYSPDDAQRIRHELLTRVEAECLAGTLRLTPEAPTPLSWTIKNLLHAIGWLVVIALLSPVLLLAAPIAIVLLRWHEKTDPEIYPRPTPAALQALRELEDRDVTNQFSALGSVKPGLFRRWLVTVILFAIDYAARHVFNRGFLGRVRTIHFARWVFIDDKQRIVFCSNYDGGHEAYMDDFINKVAWGLNLIFSNGIGWPHTDWLIKRGARLEQPFKYYQRRHQIPSQVWYHAYPGLTALDMIRNHRIREGLEQLSMTDVEALAWLKLL